MFYKKRYLELCEEVQRLERLISRVYFETLLPQGTYNYGCTIPRSVEIALDRLKDQKAKEAAQKELTDLIDARIQALRGPIDWKPL